MLIRLSQPSGLFVSLEDVKLQASIDFADDDALLIAFIKAATRLVEDRTGRTLLPIDLEWRGDAWCEPLSVPVAPLRSVTEVVYLDQDHAEATLPAADWYAVETGAGVEVHFSDTFDWPTLSDRNNQPVRVRLSAGYDEPDASGSGDDPALEQDPMDRLIVMMLVAHWYQSREPAALGATVEEVPLSVGSLLEMRRIFR